MYLTDIYRELVTAKSDLPAAAEKFGLSPKGLKIRMAKWGDRMPLMLLTLDQIVAGAIMRDDAARVLGISTRQVNLLMKSWSVERPIKQYAVTRAAAKLKWDIRKKFAIDFIGCRASVDAAADGARVSTRQIRRWVTELLAQHEGLAFKDLSRLSLEVRQRLARAIASGEQLDSETLEAVRCISEGRHSLEQEALDRVRANGKGRRFRE